MNQEQSARLEDRGSGGSSARGIALRDRAGHARCTRDARQRLITIFGAAGIRTFHVAVHHHVPAARANREPTHRRIGASSGDPAVPDSTRDTGRPSALCLIVIVVRLAGRRVVGVLGEHT